MAIDHRRACRVGRHPPGRARFTPEPSRPRKRAGLDLGGAVPHSLADDRVGPGSGRDGVRPGARGARPDSPDVAALVDRRSRRRRHACRVRRHGESSCATASLAWSTTDGASMTDSGHPDERELAVEVETGTGELRLDLGRRLVAEAIGTGLLIIAVIGSGIMATNLSPDDVGLQLLENAAATAGALIGLILMFGAVSGAHFNPVVTFVDRMFGSISSRRHRSVRGRSDDRWMRRCRRRQRDVLAARDRAVDQGAVVGGPVVVRGRRHDRAAARDPRLRSDRTCQRSAVRRRACGSVAPTGSRRRRASPTLRSRSPGRCRTASPASSRRPRRCSSSCS